MSTKSIYLYISTYKRVNIQMYSLVPIFREKKEAYRMRKFIQNKLKDQKGLTLIELLAVIVILAIIAAIAIPAIGGIIENSRVGATKADNLNALSAAELYLVDNPTATTINLAMLLGTGNDTSTTPAALPANAPVYLADKGSLSAFLYTVSGKTVASTAKAGNMTLTTTGATKANIAAYKNGSRGAGTGDAVNVSAAKD
jgi:type IV pilus assembly protein PilA